MGIAALRSAGRTMLLLVCEGVILAVVTYVWLMGGFHFAGDKWGIFSAAFSVVILLESVLVGIALAGKRAVVMALIHGLRERGLGRVAVRLLFEQLLGVTEGEPQGERGGVVAQTAERVPLAQVEKRLDDTIRGLLNARESGGGIRMWFRRQLDRQLMRLVRKCTLARFREADAKYGGINLLAVQTELESSIDEQLIRKLRYGVDAWTAVAVIFLPVQVAIGNYLLVEFVK